MTRVAALRFVLAMVLAAAGCVVVPPEDPPACRNDCCGAPECCLLVCDGGGGGGGGGGGVPVSRTVDLLWAIRLEPGTANLADAYAALVVDSARILHGASFDPRNVLVSDLYRPERGFVFQGWVTVYDAGDRLHVEVPGLADSIRRASEASGAIPDVCPSDSLAAAGASLQWLWGSTPAAVLAGILDHGPRPREYGDVRCGDPAATYASADVPWLRYHDGTVPRARTRIGLLATAEGGYYSSALQRSRCASAAGVPATALDVIAPSPLVFDDAWGSAMAQAAPELPVREELCAAIGGAWSRDLAALAPGWREALGIPPR